MNATTDPTNETATTDKAADLFALTMKGDAGAKKDAETLIRRMNARERRDLRAAFYCLDYLIDDVVLSEFREARQNGAPTI
jgi:hypothetical protein